MFLSRRWDFINIKLSIRHWNFELKYESIFEYQYAIELKIFFRISLILLGFELVGPSHLKTRRIRRS